jgi:thioredoxin 1
MILAIGPPIGLIAYHHEDLFKAPPPITPGTAKGQLAVFTADWCGACKQMRPIVDKLYAEGFDVRIYNVDRRQDMVLANRIRAVPTFVMVRDGREIRRESGVMSVEQLKKMWR